uniref:RNA helicase n=1 Tax=Globodera rostochiensis TaxID=31243 RepID=A0A914H0Z7_GLORO
MNDDIKQSLYAVLGKRKLGTPNYNVRPENRGGKSRFICQLTVAGINYVGLGNSTSKKESQANAARDFGHFLVREGFINASEIPQLQIHIIEEADIQVVGGNFQNGAVYADDNFEAQSVSLQPPWTQQAKTHHDQYVEQKAEEIIQSESVDMTSDIHGGWAMENCKQALNEFSQKNRIPTNEYRTVATGVDHNRTFVSENGIFIPSINKTINGRGLGSNKKIAETTCALSIVRQLYHMGALPGASGYQLSKKKTTAENLPEIKVRVEPSLVERIATYLRQEGIETAEELAEFTAESKPQSLLLDKKTEEFPPSENVASGQGILWAPPQPNWNAWSASNIDNQTLAFRTLERISHDLLSRETVKKIPATLTSLRRRLPVFQHREEIVNAVEQNSVVFIKGATGCGKSTQICQYLLETHLNQNKGALFNCFVTQPRRISAITLAERVTEERCEEIGDSVGYSVRFETMTPRPYGAIMFVTVGVLMRKMEHGLRGVSHVIIDEIHERDINTDFLLIVIRDMIRNNPKLKVLLMSATIDTTLFTEYFGVCPIIEVTQRAHPVQHFFLEDVVQMLNYMPPVPEPERKKKKKRKSGKETTAAATACTAVDGENADEETEDSMALAENLLTCGDGYGPEVDKSLRRMNESEIPLDIIELLLSDIDANGRNGAILIFLPGWNLISLLLNRLTLHHPVFSNQQRFLVLPLHSQLTAREQHRVFEHVPDGVRKIILSTNIAETSVTIDDVVYVIDSCRVREKMYTSRNNMVHFANVWASRTNLIQRRGRAGRVQEGFCFHLITKARFNVLEEHRTPEMLRTPLHEITLTIKLLHLGSVGAFLEKAVQPPPVDAVVEAEVLLRGMNALDKNLELTELGRILARLPIEPKMGKMIVLGAALGVGDLMITSASATSFNTPFVPRDRMYNKLSHMHRSFSGNRPSDHIGLLNVNQQFALEAEMDLIQAENFCRRYSLSFPLLSMSCEAKRQLYDVLVNTSGFPEKAFRVHPIDVHGADPNLDVFLSLMIAAYYPNVCYLRDKRRVFTLEQATALISNMSSCVPLSRNDSFDFLSPLFVFSEKLRTSCISCKQASMISPLQLLLFGSRRVEALSSDKVKLDNMIPLNMPASVAAKILALKPCIENMIIRTCLHPEQLENQPTKDKELAEILRHLSSAMEWQPTGEEGLAPDIPSHNQTSNVIDGVGDASPSKRYRSIKLSPGTFSGESSTAYRYNTADQMGYTNAQRPNFSLPLTGSASGGRRKRLYGGIARTPGIANTYGSQPVPYGAASNWDQGEAANVEDFTQDYSSLAGYAAGSYYGSRTPQSLTPQSYQRGQRGNAFGGFRRSGGRRRGFKR